MKIKTLLFGLLITALSTNAQVNIIDLIPPSTGASTQLRAPNGTDEHTSLCAHFIIPASEANILVNNTVINALGFELLNGGIMSSTGVMKIYLENTTNTTNTKSTTWSTAVATMTEVYNGNYTIPANLNAVSIDLPLTTNFTYTGGGIYVAYEYVGSTFNTSITSADVANYKSNNALAGSLYSASSYTTTLPVTVGPSSAFRPVMRFAFANQNTNDMAVEAIESGLVTFNKSYSAAPYVNALVRNKSNVALSNINVSLNVTGANATTQTVAIPSLGAGDTVTVVFSGLSTTNNGIDNITVSVPSDDNNNNNSLTVQKSISCDTIGYTYNEPAANGIGYNTGTGILASAYVANTLPTLVKSSLVSIYNDATIVGKTLTGVVVNKAGAIVGTSAPLVVLATQIGTEVEFVFTTPPVIAANDTFYVGVLQAAASPGYFPVQSTAPDIIPSNRVFGFGATGGSKTMYDDLGQIKIRARLSYDVVLSTNPVSQLCSGSAIALTASAGFSNYDFKDNGTSIQSGASNTYSYTPTANAALEVEASLGACGYSSTVHNINLVNAITETAARSFCQGGSFTFGTQNLTTPGTYTETFASQLGCDSIVTLNLTETAVDTAITLVGDVLTVNATGATFAWIKCGDNITIGGATSSTFTPTVSGNYAAVVTQNGCTDTTRCVFVNKVGLSSIELANLQIFPNPTQNVVNVKLEDVKINQMTLTDLQGRKLQTINDPAANTIISIENYSSGVYLLNIYTNDGVNTQRIIKQ